MNCSEARRLWQEFCRAALPTEDAFLEAVRDSVGLEADPKLSLDELVHHHVFGYGPKDRLRNVPAYGSNELAAGSVLIHMIQDGYRVSMRPTDGECKNKWLCEFVGRTFPQSFIAGDPSPLRAICKAAVHAKTEAAL